MSGDRIKFDHLIGTPFKLGGRDLTALDCYGLVLQVAKERGKTLPDYTSPDQFSKISEVIETNLRTWKKCDPKPGAMVVFKVPGALHCGVYLGDGKFLHTWQASGGVCQERIEDWKRRIVGFYEH